MGTAPAPAWPKDPLPPAPTTPPAPVALVPAAPAPAALAPALCAAAPASPLGGPAADSVCGLLQAPAAPAKTKTPTPTHGRRIRGRWAGTPRPVGPRKRARGRSGPSSTDLIRHLRSALSRADELSSAPAMVARRLGRFPSCLHPGGRARFRTVGFLTPGSSAGETFPSSRPVVRLRLCPRLQWRGPCRL